VRVEVRPVTAEAFPDFVRLFEGKGAPHYCFCTARRFREYPEWDKAQKKAAMERLVEAGTPIGLLAYDGGEPVGWCSVAPRESYPRLERSTAMPKADDRPTWTVVCFFVRRDHRGQDVAKALAKAAVAYARKGGAEVVEGWPWDTAGVSSTHRGHSKVFAAAGFTRDGAGDRWSRDL
jgi:GNAT superfamily N-acetyltransferase